MSVKSFAIWLIGAIVSIVLTIASIFLVPIFVLFATKDNQLPWWCSWFDTWDNTLDGDEGWKTEHFQNIKSVYLRRVLWLYRNPISKFDYYVLGAKLGKFVPVTVTGDIRVSNRPLFNGTLKLSVGNYWTFYYVKQWSSKYCVRIYLGWKLIKYAKNNSEADNAALVCSINPFMGYSLK